MSAQSTLNTYGMRTRITPKTLFQVLGSHPATRNMRIRPLQPVDMTTPFPMMPILVMRAGQILDETSVNGAVALYHRAQDLAHRMLAFMNFNPLEDDPLDPAQEALNRCAVREIVQRLVLELLHRANVVGDGEDAGACLPWLDTAFRFTQDPNEAEIQFLAQAFNTQAERLRIWFGVKKQSLYYANMVLRAAVSGDSPAAKAYRKHKFITQKLSNL